MLLTFELENVRFGVRQWSASATDQTESEEWLSFDAFPPRETLLETSAGDRVARWDDVPYTDKRPNVISASLRVTKPEAKPLKSEADYSEASDEFNSSVFIIVQLSPTIFDSLRADIRAGVPPTSMIAELVADFRDGPLKYGIDPSGLHKIWNVDDPEKSTLSFKEVSFSYKKPEPQPPTADELETAERLSQERDFDIRQRFAVIQPLKDLVNLVRLMLVLVIVLGAVAWFK